MKQIGELVGVSQSTVSRVLSGAPSIVPVAPETRERVLKLVADLGYTPNPVARALRSARTGLIGMIVRDINDPFFAAAVAAISAQIQAHRYSVLLGHVDSSAHKANELRDLLAMGHCEGAILLGDLRDQAALWADGAAHGIPLVGLWQGAREPHIPVVNVDNRAGIRLAIEHLVSLGHRRIAFVQGGRTGDGFERSDEFKRRLRELRPRLRYDCVRIADNTYSATADAVTELLTGSERPTAIVCSTDVAAIGALKSASRCGIRVPEHLSIVGFDDIPLAEFTMPSLTTVHQPLSKLGELAVEQLLRLIAQPEQPPGVTTIEPSLVVRASTAPPDR